MQEILTSLGLSEKEISIYLILIKIGLSNTQQISREMELPRQTVYSVLFKLIEEGFVEQSDKRGVKHFYADPNVLLSLIEKKKTDLERSRKMAEEEIPKILAASKLGASVPVVQYYEGREGLKRLFEGILGVYKKGEEKEFRGYGVNFFFPGLESFMQKFVEERASYGVKTRLFIGKGIDGFNITNEANTFGRDIKRLEIEHQKAGIYIVGDRAYFFSYKDNVGVMIENRSIAEFLKVTFDDHWNKSN
jgi:predicted transcriptional regulator